MADSKRITVITGASKGIGYATAQHLGRDGHTVIGLARTEPDGEFPGEFHTVDLSDRDAVSRVMETVTAAHEINGVVNNVGRSHPQAVEDVTLEEYDLVMQLNLTTALQVTQACIPAMKNQNFGRIVNIASEHALGMVPKRTTYGATKAGLINFAREWTLDLAPHGITANVVAPGPIETEMLLRNNPTDSPQRRDLLMRVPMARVGQPDEVAHAVAFFMSEGASYISGQTVYVCGGASLGSNL
jgi:3-oxoacyl-[acyl-carrier protein] reductase